MNKVTNLSSKEAKEILDEILSDGILIESFEDARYKLAIALDNAFAQGMQAQRDFDLLEKAAKL